MEHEDARLTLADLVLPGRLDPDRAAALRAHVADCPECAAELEQLRGIDARLRAAGAPVAPSEALAARVLRDAPDALVSAGPGSTEGDAPFGRTVWRSAGAWRAATAALAVAAATLLVLLVGARAERDRWSTERVVALTPAPGWDVRGTAALAHGPGGRYAVRVAVEGLEPVDDEWYELWLARSPSDRVSLGMFRPDERGRIWATVTIPKLPGEGYGGVWLTREPNDADPRWTRDWVFRARLT